MIRSFLASETIFTSNGEKVIQAIKCIEYRASLDWYIDLVASLEEQSFLQHDMILVVNTKEKGPQPFRIKNPRITSKVDIRAYHIGFDTRDYACELATVVNQNCSNAMSMLLANSADGTNFSIYSDINSLKSMSVIDSSLYDGLLQIADNYNGILDFDEWQIRITSSIGVDRGVVLSYGKNIQESEVNENWDLVVTKLKPIGNEGITLSPEWLTADISYDRPYTKIMQFDTNELSNLSLIAQLYLERYKVPRVNYKVRADVEQNIGLGDSVFVRAKQFSTNAEVLSFDYNVLSKRVEAVEFGNFHPTLKNHFAELSQQAEVNAVKKVQVKIDETNNKVSIMVNDASNQLSSNMEQIASSIRNEVSQTYLTKDENSEVVNQISTQFTQTSNDYTFLFTQLQQYVQTLDAETQTQFSEIIKYIRFVNGNIELGEINNPIKLILINDRISFTQNGAEVAYISDNILYITDGRFLNSLRIGNFAFTPRSNGSLSFGKVV